MAAQNHHLFHHNKDGENSVDGGNPVDYRKEEKNKKHLEQLGGFGVVAAGTYALVVSFF
jgi:hypothetical protein